MYMGNSIGASVSYPRNPLNQELSPYGSQVLQHWEASNTRKNMPTDTVTTGVQVKVGILRNSEMSTVLFAY